MKEGRPPSVSESAPHALPDHDDSRGKGPAVRMPVETRQPLFDHIDRHYGSLLGRLAVTLRSRDAAVDALHDLYLKLRSGVSSVDVKSPAAYLYRAAVNVAHNNRRKDSRRGDEGAAELEGWLDEAPGPETIVTARHDLDLALEALRKLPVRQQQIFLAWWQDDKSQVEIAALFGLHKRTVQKELARTEAYIRDLLRSK